MATPDHQHEQETQQRERIVARYLDVDSTKGDNRQLVTRFLIGAVWAAGGTPLLFYLRFGVVDWFAIAFTVFLVVLCLLFALGLYFQTKTEYHTEVVTERSLADRIGAFWLVGCAFGPLIGWLITGPFPPTERTWQWQYLGRVFFAVVLPVITAVPLVPYARGKAALIAIPLLIGITTLPVLTCWWVIGDLHDGASVGTVAIYRDGGQFTCKVIDEQSNDVPCDVSFLRTGGRVQVTWLPHTRRVLGIRKL